HGEALMDPRKLRLGLLFAAAAAALSFVAPLAPGVPPLLARPGLWQALVAAEALLLVAAWLADARAIVPGLAAAVMVAIVSLLLLNDPAIAGTAAAGFWAIIISAWL